MEHLHLVHEFTRPVERKFSGGEKFWDSSGFKFECLSVFDHLVGLVLKGLKFLFTWNRNYVYVHFLWDKMFLLNILIFLYAETLQARDIPRYLLKYKVRTLDRLIGSILNWDELQQFIIQEVSIKGMLPNFAS